MLMLWSLIARGLALELIDQRDGWHPFWGPVFGIGSLLVALCQGAAFGSLVAGFNVHGGDFVGGPFTFLHHGYALLTGVTAVAVTVFAIRFRARRVGGSDAWSVMRNLRAALEGDCA